MKQKFWKHWRGHGEEVQKRNEPEEQELLNLLNDNKENEILLVEEMKKQEEKQERLEKVRIKEKNWSLMKECLKYIEENREDWELMKMMIELEEGEFPSSLQEDEEEKSKKEEDNIDKETTEMPDTREGKETTDKNKQKITSPLEDEDEEQVSSQRELKKKKRLENEGEEQEATPRKVKSKIKFYQTLSGEEEVKVGLSVATGKPRMIPASASVSSRVANSPKTPKNYKNEHEYSRMRSTKMKPIKLSEQVQRPPRPTILSARKNEGGKVKKTPVKRKTTSTNDNRTHFARTNMGTKKINSILHYFEHLSRGKEIKPVIESAVQPEAELKQITDKSLHTSNFNLDYCRNDAIGGQAKFVQIERRGPIGSQDLDLLSWRRENLMDGVIGDNI